MCSSDLEMYADATGYSIDDINIRNAQDAFHGTADSYADFAENKAGGYVLCAKIETKRLVPSFVHPSKRFSITFIIRFYIHTPLLGIII